MNKQYFPENSIPKVYAYTYTRFANCITIGYTTKTPAERLHQLMKSNEELNEFWRNIKF